MKWLEDVVSFLAVLAFFGVVLFWCILLSA